MPVYDEENNELGKLESFSDDSMQYLFNIRLVDGSLITLPYVDAFFPKIDTKNKRITMIMPEYEE
ncbi:Ribosome maturation factor RimM [compost metagenome]